MHTARMADRLTLLTLGVTRASKQVLLEVLLNLLPPQREHIGVDQDLRSARDQGRPPRNPASVGSKILLRCSAMLSFSSCTGSLLDTEVYQLTHVFDTGRHCQLTLLDGPQLSDLYGEFLSRANLLAQH